MDGKSLNESLVAKLLVGKYSSSLPGVGISVVCIGVGTFDEIGVVGVVVDIWDCLPVKFMIVPIWFPAPITIGAVLLI